MEKPIRYYIADFEKRILFMYASSIYEEKLIEFLNSFPKFIKEKTFPILNISRKDGKTTCNLERYFKSENIEDKNYNILEYRVKEADVDNKDFLKSEDNCSTNAYDIYVRWEEIPNIVNYVNKYITMINPVIGFFDIDFSLIYQLLSEVSSSEEHTNVLLQKFMDCFEFSVVDQFPFHEVQFILDAEQYPSLNLKNCVASLRKAFENGRKNYQTFNPAFKEKDSSSEIISYKNEYKLLVEKMKNEKNELGRYVNASEQFLELEEVLQSGRSFSLICLSDEGDLYTYKVFISFPLLYEFMTYLNSNYKAIKEKVFEELDWDCYENKPILTNVLDKNIVKNNGYRILDFDVKKENIHIRTQKAETVYVKWEESVDLIQYINDFIFSLRSDLQVDWSNISSYFDKLSINEEAKKQLYYSFFSCFHFGEPIEIIPSNVISVIENYLPHQTLNLEHQKSILKQKMELGIHNREFFSLLLDNGIVTLPKRLSQSMDCQVQ